MKIWMSGEVQHDVADSYRELRKEFESAINRVFTSKDFGSSLSEWVFIAMIFGDLGPSNYKEINRYTKKDKSFESRLKIDHTLFRDANHKEQSELLYEALRRSLSILEEMGIHDVNIQAIRSELTGIAAQNDWLAKSPRD